MPTNGRGYDEIAVFDASDDWYTFELSAGQLVSVALGELEDVQGTIELYDAAGQLLTIGQTDIQNLDSIIAQFEADVTGRYYVRVLAAEADYALVVSRDAAFNAEPDDRIDQAHDITAASAALGGLAFDRYKQSITQTGVGDLQTLTYEFNGVFSPSSDAVLTFEAIADLSNVNEYLSVSIEGIDLGNLFAHGGVDLQPVDRVGCALLCVEAEREALHVVEEVRPEPEHQPLTDPGLVDPDEQLDNLDQDGEADQSHACHQEQ